MLSDDEILTAISEHRFAVAKREISARIARNPNKSYYQALHAYYLWASGSADTTSACNALRKKTPSDALTLELLFDTYTKMGSSTDAFLVYKNAAKKYPSTDLIAAWFNKALLALDIPMLYDASSAMIKHSPKMREYAFHAAFAKLQWHTKDETGAHLQDALDLLAGFLPVQNNQEAFVHASLLSAAEMYWDVIKALKDIKHKELELILMYLAALHKTQAWDLLYNECETLLFAENFNDYDTWKLWIEAAKALEKPSSGLLARLKFDSRNSYLANIEICRTYGLNLLDAVEKYYAQYESKPCCVLDLMKFELPAEFIGKLHAKKAGLIGQSSMTIADTRVVINIEKALTFLEPDSRVDWAQYQKFDNPELGELYLTAMVQGLAEEMTTKKVVEHLVVLKHFAELDSENFYFQLWRLNLLSTINCSSMALQTYHDLKIKMIQHDTLFYKLNLEPSGKNLNELLRIFRFYLTGEQETEKFLQVALEKGLYTKLGDIIRFSNRLRTSAAKHSLTLQILKMARMLNSDYYPYFLNRLREQKAEILSDRFVISDNRDFNTDFDMDIQVQNTSLFAKEKKLSAGLLKIMYLKEILIGEAREDEATRLLKLLEKWLSNSEYQQAMSPSEFHFSKMFLALMKTCRGAQKGKEEQVKFLVKHYDFQEVQDLFLSQTSPLSSSAMKVLVEVSDLIKTTNAILSETALLAQCKKFQQGLVQYVITNPEVNFFKSLRSDIRLDHLPEPFVESELDSLEDHIRQSKFKLK